jgi:multidrug efflux pump subunit AcrA (membrane-fusion protein)
MGNIEPLEVRNLTAPFRGRIAEKNFEYGELVTKGQVLARLDPTEVEVELRKRRGGAFPRDRGVEPARELGAQSPRWRGPNAPSPRRN